MVTAHSPACKPSYWTPGDPCRPCSSRTKPAGLPRKRLPTDPPRWDDEDGSEEESSDVGRADAADFTDPAEADDADGCPLQRVSASTGKLLQEAFAKPVPNATRRRWRRTYGMPATDVTKCPKLDTTLRPQVPKDGKDGDRSLSRLQTLLLDARGPLSAMLESHQAGRLAPETAPHRSSPMG